MEIKQKTKIYLNYEAKQKSKLLGFKYHLGPHGLKWQIITNCKMFETEVTLVLFYPTFAYKTF